MTCGTNAHDNFFNEGCGLKFSWLAARPYKPDLSEINARVRSEEQKYESVVKSSSLWESLRDFDKQIPSLHVTVDEGSGPSLLPRASLLNALRDRTNTTVQSQLTSAEMELMLRFTEMRHNGRLLRVLPDLIAFYQWYDEANTYIIIKI